MQTNERGVVSVISRDSLNEAYSGLEAKHNEIIRALTHRIACCGACAQFPCDTIMTKPHTTVLNKDWLRWKKESNR